MKKTRLLMTLCFSGGAAWMESHAFPGWWVLAGLPFFLSQGYLIGWGAVQIGFLDD